MITTEELKKKALNFYRDVLRSEIKGEQYFPKTVPTNKILSNDFVVMSKELAPLIASSKEVRGFGYTITYRSIKTRLHGIQDIPDSIIFPTLDDYLPFVQKRTEFNAFKINVSVILQAYPSLINWALNNITSIISFDQEWPDLLAVCRWFTAGYEENKYYIREMPVQVHTKFIETHTGILKSLLDELIPDKALKEEDIFEKRYKIKYAEPRIRIRFLEERLFVEGRFKDISIPLHEFQEAYFNCSRIIVTENKMNFLTLPEIKDTIAIWGGGYAVRNLKGTEWLTTKQIIYWGDIDAQGFEILSQLRGYFRQTISIMMDRETFQIFEIYHTKGTSSRIGALNYLLNDEQNLYNDIKTSNLRLEQEKIPQNYVNSILDKIGLCVP